LQVLFNRGLAVWCGSSLLGVAPSALNLLEDVALVHTDPCQCVFPFVPEAEGPCAAVRRSGLYGPLPGSVRSSKVPIREKVRKSFSPIAGDRGQPPARIGLREFIHVSVTSSSIRPTSSRVAFFADVGLDMGSNGPSGFAHLPWQLPGVGVLRVDRCAVPAPGEEGPM
jgi:hypothetical protein